MCFSILNPSAAELKRIRAGSETAFQLVYDRWQSEIRRIARGFARYAFACDDYAQVGAITLHHVCLHIPLDCAKPFERYARSAIKKAMIDQSRKDRGWRFQLVKYVEPESIPEQESQSPQPVDILIAAQEHLALENWHATLTGEKKMIAESLYKNGDSQTEIAKTLNLSATRISQINRVLISNARTFFAYSMAD